MSQIVSSWWRGGTCCLCGLFDDVVRRGAREGIDL